MLRKSAFGVRDRELSAQRDAIPERPLQRACRAIKSMRFCAIKAFLTIFSVIDYIDPHTYTNKCKHKFYIQKVLIEEDARKDNAENGVKKAEKRNFPNGIIFNKLCPKCKGRRGEECEICHTQNAVQAVKTKSAAECKPENDKHDTAKCELTSR